MMSSASVCFFCSKKGDATSVLENMVTHGWDYNYYNSLWFLPLGTDNYDWDIFALDSWQTRLDDITEKSIRGETVGVRLLYLDGAIGISILFLKDARIILIPDSSFPVISDIPPINDFSWLIKQVVKSIGAGGYEIQRIEASQDWD